MQEQGINTGLALYSLARIRELRLVERFASPKYIQTLEDKFGLAGSLAEQVMWFVYDSVEVGFPTVRKTAVNGKYTDRFYPDYLSFFAVDFFYLINPSTVETHMEANLLGLSKISFEWGILYFFWLWLY